MPERVEDGIFGPNTIKFTVTEPYWRIPINDFMLMHLGRMTLMWAGIDDTLDSLICTVHGISWDQEAAFTAGKMVSGKLEVLEAGLYRIKDDAHRERAKTLYGLIRKALPRRNIAFHGSWGYYISDDAAEFIPGAFSSRKRGTRFYADDLYDLHEEIAEIDHQIHALYNELAGFPGPPPEGERPRKFFSKKEVADQILSPKFGKDIP